MEYHGAEEWCPGRVCWMLENETKPFYMLLVKAAASPGAAGRGWAAGAGRGPCPCPLPPAQQHPSVHETLC